MTADQLHLLRDSFRLIEEKADIAALVFYRHLFTAAPELRAMFNTSMEVQGKKLMESLRHTIGAIEKPEIVVPILESLGRRHVAYGTKSEHYAIVAAAMMRMLEEVLGSHFTPDTSRAWRDTLHFVASTMQRGAAEAKIE